MDVVNLVQNGWRFERIALATIAIALGLLRRLQVECPCQVLTPLRRLDAIAQGFHAIRDSLVNARFSAGEAGRPEGVRLCLPDAATALVVT